MSSDPCDPAPYTTIVTTGTARSALTSMCLWLRFVLAALILPASNMTAAQAGPNTASMEEALKYEGHPIESIQFDPADQPLTERDLKRALTFAPGSIFHVHALRQTIQNLFATGRFSDLAVDATEVRGGVALLFITKRAYFVGRVVIRGVKAPPNEGELISASKLRLGEPYSDADQKRALQSVQSTLQDNGFFHATIDTEVERRAQTEQANILFDVHAGKRARFERPEIQGVPARTDRTIIRISRWKRLYGYLGWQEVTEARVRQGIDNIRRYYEKRNFLGTRVTLSKLQYHDSANSVEPFVDIQTGTLVTVKAVGASIGLGKLKQLVPVFQEQSIDSDLLLEGQQNIQEYLVSSGYFGARVSYEMSDGHNLAERTITYHIARGPRHKFVHLGIEGNTYFLEQTIRERLYLQPAEFPRFPYGRFSYVYLKQDIQSIETLYASNGFRDVNVTYDTQDDYHGAKNHLAVFLKIHEGPQWFVSQLDIKGAGEQDYAPLRRLLISAPGQPFSETAISEDRENFLNYYYDRGYLNATFDYIIEPDDRPEHVNIRYILRPGTQRYVRQILITGLETTRKSLVTDRVELKNGAPLSLAEETDTQRRLYDLGIFARVDTAVQNPDGDEVDKNVLFEIDEARHYSINVGVGAQIARIGGGVTSLDNPAGTTGFAPRVAFGVSRINLLGLGQTVGVQTSLSTIEQRATLTYFIPEFVSNQNLNLTFTALLENSNDIRTFTAHRREASIQLGQRLSRAYTAQYRLVFRNVTLSNLKIDQLLVPLLSQPETAGMAEVSIIEDKRDDPADARRGVYNTIDLAYAPAFLGSQTQFARGLFRNSTYHPFHHDLVFARSTQFGVITRTGGRESIPLAERLYSGGSTSIRAFPDFQAGPRDLETGFPLGGDALFINNFEMRFPLYGENLAGVLFQDAGNVYSSLGDMSFRFRQPSLQDFNYTVQDVGIGFRYKTPIGPIRVDLSFSPDAPRFYGLKGTLQDLINGTAVATVQKINAFQFHFSLGQAF